MLLAEFVRTYCTSRDLATNSVSHLTMSVHALEDHAGKPLKTHDLSKWLVEVWIESRLLAGRSRIHIARQRSDLLTIWRAAHDEGIADEVPNNIRFVKLRTPPPKAWWPDEFKKLLQSIDTLPGAFACGVPKRLLLKALALVGYYSGLRPSDLRALRTCDIAANGRLAVVMQKTGAIHECTLPPDALAAIAATRPHGRALLFPISRKNLCFVWREASKRAGVPGTPKWLRRTGATRCEQQQSGSSMSYLSHKTPGLSFKHYVDPQQIASKRPVPPRPDAA